MKQTSSRLAKETRGFYRKLNPGFYGVRDAFERAAKDGKPMRFSTKTSSENRALGYLMALRKYALLDQFDEPIEALAKRLSESNFGYNGPAQQERAIDPLWGKSTERPSGLIDSLGGIVPSLGSNKAV